MRRIETVSLFFLLAAAAVLTITLQMDYGSARKWMFFLFLALLLPAMNPKFYKNRTRRQEHVFTPIEREETEEDEMGFIDLSSAEPINRVGRLIAYIFGIVSFGFVAVGGLILPFVKELGVGSSILCWLFSGVTLTIGIKYVMQKRNR